ncbi:PREDICTED: proteinase inhibitor PSI-1.2-like isoform X2 [Ipomoea nil]|uniref:proteinase inhibitor PSI-1.2-like isoform X2 n=1 Tax=Ipomoea nil TaxID=35883 RepID=UPI000900B947|nr:PREDICTED: proteinase inhibitor PSI-1.2-like isoform X2 [Ipomoea nil]
MAVNKVVILLAFLLVCGIVLIRVDGQYDGGKVCAQVCEQRVATMKCPPGNKPTRPLCVNCCTAGTGCKLFRSDGSLLCTGT